MTLRIVPVDRDTALGFIARLYRHNLSRVVNGHDGMQLDMVDRVLAACGRRLVLATEVLTDRGSDE